MSMNLYCDEVDLWQTPTAITEMCMSLNENGNPDGGWKGIRRRYLHWVRGSLNGVWESKVDLNRHRSLVESHVDEIMRHRILHFMVV